MFGADLLSAERDALHEHIAKQPQRYVAQEWVHVSQAPVLDLGSAALPARRANACAAAASGCACLPLATPGGYRVMPGGLTRVAGDGDTRVVAMQRGGWSKDTWVLSQGRSTLRSRCSRRRSAKATWPAPPRRCRRAPPRTCSGSAATAKRCEAAARLLRVALSRLLDASAAAGDALLRCARWHCARAARRRARRRCRRHAAARGLAIPRAASPSSSAAWRGSRSCSGTACRPTTGGR